MKAVESIPKSGRNERQHYDYVREVDVKERLRTAFIQQNVVPVFGFEVDDVVPREAGGIVFVVRGSMTLYDLDTGEHITMSVCGSGWDSTDKGVYKAITGAIKYALTTAFLIPTGDDPEVDGHVEAKLREIASTKQPAKTPVSKPVMGQKTGKPISEAQAKRLYAIFKSEGEDNGWTKNDMGLLLEKYGYSDSRQICGKADYEAICAALQAPINKDDLGLQPDDVPPLTDDDIPF